MVFIFHATQKEVFITENNLDDELSSCIYAHITLNILNFKSD